MQVLFAYLIKLALCLAIGYLFYFLLLRRMTWYTWNRYFLLFFPLVAMAIPLVRLEFSPQLQALKADFFITGSLPQPIDADTLHASPQTIPWNMVNTVLILYATGMMFCLFRFLFRMVSLYRTRQLATLVKNGDVKLYHLPGCTAPFSFNDGIYLDTTFYDQPELEKILEHELVHVTQKHTLDILAAEFICVIQWFNPFVWMMKHAMKQNLEFIADDAVLKKGISRKGYQYLLLKVSGAIPHSIATNLLFPSLKKRIYMMNRDRTDKKHLFKFLCLLPVAALLVFTFSTQPAKTVHSNTDDFSVSSISFYINDENAAKIIENEQSRSLLKEGGALSLSLINEEKTRLKTLLEKNGYDTAGGRSISFVMDSSLTNKSFAVKVVVDAQVKEKKNHSPGGEMAGMRRSYDPSYIQTKPYIKVLAARGPGNPSAKDNTAILSPGSIH